MASRAEGLVICLYHHEHGLTIQVSRLQWRRAFTSVIELTLNSWCYKQTSPSARDAMLFTFVPNSNIRIYEKKHAVNIYYTCTSIWGIPGRFNQAVALTFFLIQLCYGGPQKMTYTNFRIFFENFSGINGQIRRGMRALKLLCPQLRWNDHIPCAQIVSRCFPKFLCRIFFQNLYFQHYFYQDLVFKNF